MANRNKVEIQVDVKSSGTSDLKQTGQALDGLTKKTEQFNEAAKPAASAATALGESASDAAKGISQMDRALSADALKARTRATQEHTQAVNENNRATDTAAKRAAAIARTANTTTKGSFKSAGPSAPPSGPPIDLDLERIQKALEKDAGKALLDAIKRRHRAADATVELNEQEPRSAEDAARLAARKARRDRDALIGTYAVGPNADRKAAAFTQVYREVEREEATRAATEYRLRQQAKVAEANRQIADYSHRANERELNDIGRLEARRIRMLERWGKTADTRALLNEQFDRESLERFKDAQRYVAGISSAAPRNPVQAAEARIEAQRRAAQDRFRGTGLRQEINRAYDQKKAEVREIILERSLSPLRRATDANEATVKSAPVPVAPVGIDPGLEAKINAQRNQLKGMFAGDEAALKKIDAEFDHFITSSKDVSGFRAQQAETNKIAKAQEQINAMVERERRSRLSVADALRAEQKEAEKIGRTPEQKKQIRDLYQPRIEEAESAGVHGNQRRLILGAKDLLEGYSRGALIEGVDYLMSLRAQGGGKNQGLGGIVSGVTTAAKGLGISPLELGIGGTTLALGAAAVAATKFVAEEAKLASQTVVTAHELGLTVEQVERFTAMAKLAGGEFSSFEAAANTLGNALAHPAEQGKKVALELSRAGIAIYGLNGRARETGPVFEDLLKKLASIKDVNARFDLANKILPPEEVRRLHDVIANVDDLNKRALDLGIKPRSAEELAKIHAQFQDLDILWNKLKEEFAVQLAPTAVFTVKFLRQGLEYADKGVGQAPVDTLKDIKDFFLYKNPVPGAPLRNAVNGILASQPQTRPETPEDRAYAQLQSRIDGEKAQSAASAKAFESKYGASNIELLQEKLQKLTLERDTAFGKIQANKETPQLTSDEERANEKTVRRLDPVIRQLQRQIENLRNADEIRKEFDARVDAYNLADKKDQFSERSFGRLPDIIYGEPGRERAIQDDTRFSGAQKRELLERQKQRYQGDLSVETTRLKTQQEREALQERGEETNAATAGLERQFSTAQRLQDLNEPTGKSTREGVRKAYQEELSLAAQIRDKHLADLDTLTTADNLDEKRKRNAAILRQFADKQAEADSRRVLALAEIDKREEDAARSVSQIQRQSKVDALERQIRLQQQLAVLTNGRETSGTIATGLAQETALNKLVNDIQRLDILSNKRLSDEEKSVELARLEYQYHRQDDEARLDAAMRYLSLQREGLERSRDAARDLYQSMRTNPNGPGAGAADFFKRQGDKIAENAFSAIAGKILNQIGGQLTKPLEGTLKKLGLEDIFKGTFLDHPERAVDENTKALRELTEAITGRKTGTDTPEENPGGVIWNGIRKFLHLPEKWNMPIAPVAQPQIPQIPAPPVLPTQQDLQPPPPAQEQRPTILQHDHATDPTDSRLLFPRTIEPHVLVQVPKNPAAFSGPVAALPESKLGDINLPAVPAGAENDPHAITELGAVSLLQAGQRTHSAVHDLVKLQEASSNEVNLSPSGFRTLGTLFAANELPGEASDRPSLPLATSHLGKADAEIREMDSLINGTPEQQKDQRGYFESAKDTLLGGLKGLVHIPTFNEVSPTLLGSDMQGTSAGLVREVTNQAAQGNLAGAAGTLTGVGANVAALSALGLGHEKIAGAAGEAASRVRAFAEAAKEHPLYQKLRDERGSVVLVTRPRPKGIQLYSPNEAENLTFQQAAEGIKSPEHQHIVNVSEAIDRELGLKSTHTNAIGDWADGAENSIRNIIHGAPSYEAIRYSAALKGEIANQKAVIPFQVRSKGPDSLYRMTVPGATPEQLRASLDEEGIQFRTLIPKGKAGTEVSIFDQGSELTDAVERFSNKHNVDAKQFRGQGEFLGGDTREEGHDAYRKVIADFEAKTGHRLYRRFTGHELPTAETRPSATPQNSVTEKVIKAVAGSGRPEPNLEIRNIANAYNRERGRGEINHDLYPEVDEAKARQVADAYENLQKFNPAPEVQAAYAALSKEIKEQWDYAVSQGIQFEPWRKEGQPYANSLEMADDVRKNKHLAFYTGGEAHPLLNQIDPDTGVTRNDEFRAIHDLFGHAAGGFGFGPRGEEAAFQTHYQMFSEAAQAAMATETRGQNSWVNFGRQNFGPDGKRLNIPAAERPFAEQKVDLLPEHLRVPTSPNLLGPKDVLDAVQGRRPWPVDMLGPRDAFIANGDLSESLPGRIHAFAEEASPEDYAPSGLNGFAKAPRTAPEAAHRNLYERIISGFSEATTPFGPRPKQGSVYSPDKPGMPPGSRTGVIANGDITEPDGPFARFSEFAAPEDYAPSGLNGFVDQTSPLRKKLNGLLDVLKDEEGSFDPTFAGKLKIRQMASDPQQYRAYFKGKLAGGASWWKDLVTGKPSIYKSVVEPEFRRKGVATALYSHIENEIGTELTPSSALSDDGFAFWNKYRPSAVADDLRHHRDDLIGKEFTHEKYGTGVISSVGSRTVTVSTPRGTEYPVTKTALADGGYLTANEASPLRQKLNGLLDILKDETGSFGPGSGRKKKPIANENSILEHIAPPEGEPMSPLSFPITGVRGSLDRLRRAVNRPENLGGPDNSRSTFKSGSDSIVFGKLTQDDWIKRVQNTLSPEEVDASRKWYPSLQGFFEEHFGKEAAPRFSLAWLLSQQNASPSFGMTNVFRALDLVRGMPKEKTAGLSEKAMMEALRGGAPEAGYSAKLSDFVDSALGKTTRTVMGNDPRGGAPAVIDVWAARDVGFIDEKMLKFLGEKFAPTKSAPVMAAYNEQVKAANEAFRAQEARLKGSGAGKDIKVKMAEAEKRRDAIISDATKERNKKLQDLLGVKIDITSAPSETEYEYGSKFYNDVANKLNAKGLYGGKWTPSEVQATGWVAMQKATGATAEFPEDMFRVNTRTANVPLDKVKPEQATEAIEKIAKQTGVLVRKSQTGATQAGKSAAVDIIGSPEAAQDFLDLAKLQLGGDSISTRPLKSGANTAVDVKSPALANPDVAAKFWKLVQSSLPDTARNYQSLNVDGEPALRSVTLDGKLSKKDFEKYSAAVANAAKELGIEAEVSRNEVELLRSQKPNPERLKRIKAAAEANETKPYGTLDKSPHGFDVLTGNVSSIGSLEGLYSGSSAKSAATGKYEDGFKVLDPNTQGPPKVRRTPDGGHIYGDGTYYPPGRYPMDEKTGVPEIDGPTYKGGPLGGTVRPNDAPPDRVHETESVIGAIGSLGSAIASAKNRPRAGAIISTGSQAAIASIEAIRRARADAQARRTGIPATRPSPTASSGGGLLGGLAGLAQATNTNSQATAGNTAATGGNTGAEQENTRAIRDLIASNRKLANAIASHQCGCGDEKKQPGQSQSSSIGGVINGIGSVLGGIGGGSGARSSTTGTGTDDVFTTDSKLILDGDQTPGMFSVDDIANLGDWNNSELGQLAGGLFDKGLSEITSSLKPSTSGGAMSETFQPRILPSPQPIDQHPILHKLGSMASGWMNMAQKLGQQAISEEDPTAGAMMSEMFGGSSDGLGGLFGSGGSSSSDSGGLGSIFDGTDSGVLGPNTPAPWEDSSGPNLGQQGFGAGNILGGAMGAFQAFSGFKGFSKHGDNKSLTSGIGGALTTAAALDPEPISKGVLAVAALAANIVSAFMPSAQQIRKKELEREIFAQQKAAFPYNQPGLNIEMTTGGRVGMNDEFGNFESLSAINTVQNGPRAVGWLDPDHTANLTTMNVRTNNQTNLLDGTGFTQTFGGYRAAGGRVDPFHKYVIGEKGWETFVPDMPGTILPHDLSAQALESVASPSRSSAIYAPTAVSQSKPQPQVGHTIQINMPVSAVDSKDILRRSKDIVGALSKELRSGSTGRLFGDLGSINAT